MAIRRSFTLTVSPELAQAIHQFMHAEGFSTPNEACRAALVEYFSSTPADGAIMSAKLRAFNATRVWSMTETAKHFEQLARDLRNSAKTHDDQPHS